MNLTRRLCDMKPGETARIHSLTAPPDIRRRLEDLGFISGTIVECILQSPLGDPLAFLIRGAIIALRNDDSKHIFAEVF